MIVSQARQEDVEGIAYLFNEYRMFYGKQSDINGTKDYISKRLTHKESVIFFVKKDGSYAGFSQLYPSFSSISMKRDWILNDLFVDSDARGQGVGNMLLQKAKEYAIQTGAKGISLCTTVDNEQAQRLYEKNGYVRDSHYYHYELDTSFL